MIEKNRQYWANSVVSRSLTVLSSADRAKLFWILIIQISMDFLDLIGVIAIGALGALSIQGIESKGTGNKVGGLLRVLHIQNENFQTQIAFLGIGAGVVLITKTVLSVYFTRKTFFFLSRRSAKVSSELISKILSRDLLQIQSRTTQETLFIITDGVNSILIDILATSITIVTDFSLLLIISIGLLVVDPIVASTSIILFAVVGLTLYQLTQVRARKLGEANTDLQIRNSQKILEVLNSYRESVVRNRRRYYAEEIGKMRYALANVTAEFSFMPYISKYVFESITIMGSLILSGIEFSSKNAVHAVSTLAVFLAASSRITPAALRLQQGLIRIRQANGSAAITFALIDELKETNVDDIDDSNYSFLHNNFIPEIKIRDLAFTYRGGNHFALKNIDLEIYPGSSVAIVGPSGAGKTTLIDLILGVLSPTSGSISISNITPRQAAIQWPGAISYVPQNVMISNGTIRENVAMGYPVDVAKDFLVSNALKIAQLGDAVKLMPLHLESPVGENGSQLSGGQRQRLGIARAMFTSPKLLVLDEATSALDGQTEADITHAIKSLHGQVTVIVVAHRLSTVRQVDQIIYMEKGQIKAVGSFEKVRRLVPNFDTQASLMGL